MTYTEKYYEQIKFLEIHFDLKKVQKNIIFLYEMQPGIE